MRDWDNVIRLRGYEVARKMGKLSYKEFLNAVYDKVQEIEINPTAFPKIHSAKNNVLAAVNSLYKKDTISENQFHNAMELFYEWGDMPTGINRGICLFYWGKIDE